jgi:hypothetical protein
MIDIPKPYADTYAVQQTLVALGFSSNDIFVGCISMLSMEYVQTKNMLTVQLRQGDLTCNFAVANMGDDAVQSEVNARWEKFATDVISGAYSDEDLDKLVAASPISAPPSVVKMIQALRKKGFTSPRSKET